MGVIRKVISGTAALCTGGLSLGVLQFRSDTERGTRQTRLLREEMERQHRERMKMDEAYIAAYQQAIPGQGTIHSNAYAAAFNSLPSSVGSTSQPISRPAIETITSQLENIARLALLRDKGALTDTEFETEKQKVLNGLGYSNNTV